MKMGTKQKNVFYGHIVIDEDTLDYNVFVVDGLEGHWFKVEIDGEPSQHETFSDALAYVTDYAEEWVDLSL